MSNILSKKILIPLIAVAIITGAFFVINNQSQADEEYVYAFTGYTYISTPGPNGTEIQRKAGVEVQLSIDGHEYTAYSEESPEYGRYNIGHYSDTGQFCLRGVWDEGVNEQRDAHQGSKEQTSTYQHTLVLSGTGPECTGY